MDIRLFARELATKVGGTFQEFDNLCMISYPLQNGIIRDVFASVISKPGSKLVGFTSIVGAVNPGTDFRKLLDFSHHQCYSKVTISGENICVSAVTEAAYTSEAQMRDMVHEVAYASAQLAEMLLKLN